MSNSLEAVADVLLNHHSFVLTTHVSPDGDGLGSEVALAEWLAGHGKQVATLNYSPTPYFYQFLDPSKRIKQFVESEDAGLLARAQVIIVLDTNQTDRVRSLEPHLQKSAAIKLCIDHHLNPQPFASHYLIDDDATSTGEIVYRLLMHIDKGISPVIAQALYCAIVTDTGSFRYPRVDAEIHRIVAHLIECGADPVRIYQEVYEQWSAGRVQLLGEALATLKTEYNGLLAHITITRESLERTGTAEEDTDNFTVYPMSIAGVVAGILFLEMPDGMKMSFRSKGDIPINELAAMYGGGGHKNAAGARQRGISLSELKPQVLKAAKQFVLKG